MFAKIRAIVGATAKEIDNQYKVVNKTVSLAHKTASLLEKGARKLNNVQPTQPIKHEAL